MALEDCKKRASKLIDRKNFKELGGYVLGYFNGETIQIRHFLIDTNSESTSIRIRLSSEAFARVEQLRESFSSFKLLHVGDWHVHPGMEKPFYSKVDVATLFLERFQLQTDNPEEVMTPKIHLIFNESLSEMSLFVMDLEMECKMVPLLNLEKEASSVLSLLEASRSSLDDAVKAYKMEESKKKYEIINSNLECVMDNIEELLEETHDIKQCYDELEWFKENQEKLKRIIGTELQKDVKMGILVKGKKGKLEHQNYRPKNIENAFLDEKLLGFWKFFPHESVSPVFHKIFLANFINHLDEDAETTLYFAVLGKQDKFKIVPYHVFIRPPHEVIFKELLPDLW
ncbi:MAG: hypothetical protein ACTSSI_15750 [Candidatus Helarchaeota archaeon]